MEGYWYDEDIILGFDFILSNVVFAALSTYSAQKQQI